MNKHLEPIFKILLPKLEEAQIDYWVYGGISIAAFAGKFIRENRDVDTFVKEADFQKTKLLLEDLCSQNNFELRLKGENKRPKIEIIIGGKERFSMIPVYQKNNTIIFLHEKKYGGNEEYAIQLLEKVERNISGYRFFTPLNKFIREIFINHIKVRPDKKNRANFKTDARALLAPEEYEAYGLNK